MLSAGISVWLGHYVDAGVIFAVVVINAIVVFFIFSYYLQKRYHVDYARTVAVNTMVMIEALYLLSSRFFSQTIFHPDILKGIRPMLIAITLVVVGQLLFTYLPLAQNIFTVRALTLQDWGFILLASSVVLLVVEADKALSRKGKSREQ
jgi:magnesium-transporting ATPase (P-type)